MSKASEIAAERWRAEAINLPRGERCSAPYDRWEVYVDDYCDWCAMPPGAYMHYGTRPKYFKTQVEAMNWAYWQIYLAAERERWKKEPISNMC